MVLGIPRGAVPMAKIIADTLSEAMVYLNLPAEFRAVGQFFRNLSQVSDEDVVETLRQREARISAAG